MFLTDDGENNGSSLLTTAAATYITKKTNVALCGGKYDVPAENAMRWQKQFWSVSSSGGEMKTLQNAFVVTSFVSSFADDTDVDGMSPTKIVLVAVALRQYVGNEAYTAENVK